MIIWRKKENIDFYEACRPGQSPREIEADWNDDVGLSNILAISSIKGKKLWQKLEGYRRRETMKGCVQNNNNTIWYK